MPVTLRSKCLSGIQLDPLGTPRGSQPWVFTDLPRVSASWRVPRLSSNRWYVFSWELCTRHSLPISPLNWPLLGESQKDTLSAFLSYQTFSLTGDETGGGGGDCCWVTPKCKRWWDEEQTAWIRTGPDYREKKTFLSSQSRHSNGHIQSKPTEDTGDVNPKQ